jgi:hypothetical protein
MGNGLQPWHVLGLFDVERVIHFGDLLAIVTILFATIGGMVSLARFRRTLKESALVLQSAHYSELDRAYAEILRAAIDAPHLRTPAAIETDADACDRDYLPYADGDDRKRAQYDTYAFLVWNFIETIHDRCLDNARLKATWTPVIRVEDSIHRGWFLAQMRNEAQRRRRQGDACPDTHKFCKEFRIFVFEHQWNDADWAYRTEWRTHPEFGP